MGIDNMINMLSHLYSDIRDVDDAVIAVAIDVLN